MPFSRKQKLKTLPQEIKVKSKIEINTNFFLREQGKGSTINDQGGGENIRFEFFFLADVFCNFFSLGRPF